MSSCFFIANGENDCLTSSSADLESFFSLRATRNTCSITKCPPLLKDLSRKSQNLFLVFLVLQFVLTGINAQDEVKSTSEAGLSLDDVTQKVDYLERDLSPTNLGIYRPNSKIVIEFKVTNSIPVELELVGSKTSCGCSKLQLVNSKLSPSETLSCSLSIDTGAKETDRTIQVILAFRRPNDELPSVVSSRLFSLQVRRLVSWSAGPQLEVSRREPTVFTV